MVSKVKGLFSLMMTYELDMKRCLRRGLEDTNVNLYVEIVISLKRIMS